MSNYPPLSPTELHLLYVLLDSNLPTGGFVSSSGLESYAKHGFLSIPSNPDPYRTRKGDETSHAHARKAPRGIQEVTAGMVGFAEAEVGQYASTTGCFVRSAWEVVDAALGSGGSNRTQAEDTTMNLHQGADNLVSVLEVLQAIDDHHEATLLSHVARRASKAQGVAMLTLYTRGLSRPARYETYVNGDRGHPEGIGLDADRARQREEQAKAIIDGYKRLVRRGEAPGHLASCWGMVTAALGINPVRALHLHLFLHARSLLSSAVRLNLIGPYASSQLLLHPFQSIIEREALREGSSRPSAVMGGDGTGVMKLESGDDAAADSSRGFWDWTEEAESGPATTWPLGEVLMGRHDMQHSRIFNS